MLVKYIQIFSSPEKMSAKTSLSNFDYRFWILADTEADVQKSTDQVIAACKAYNIRLNTNTTKVYVVRKNTS